MALPKIEPLSSEFEVTKKFKEEKSKNSKTRKINTRFN